MALTGYGITVGTDENVLFDEDSGATRGTQVVKRAQGVAASETLIPFAGTVIAGQVEGDAMTGTFAALVDPSGNYQILKIWNHTDGYIDISLDGGTTLHFSMAPGEKETLDMRDQFLLSGVVDVRDGTVTGDSNPSTGTVLAYIIK